MNPEDERVKKNPTQQLSANGKQQDPAHKKRLQVFEAQSRKKVIGQNQAQQRGVQNEAEAKTAEFYKKRSLESDQRKKAEKEQGSTKTRLDPMHAKRQEKFQQQSQGVAKTQEKKRERER